MQLKIGSAALTPLRRAFRDGAAESSRTCLANQRRYYLNRHMELNTETLRRKKACATIRLMHDHFKGALSKKIMATADYCKLIDR